MSGHSKWATTKRQKANIDAKRANVFTKLTKAIMLAARDGEDPTMNFKLRVAIDKAKGANMPKDNIERAIARGAGKNGDSELSEITYEGFGPEKIGVIIETVTDNRNRTVANIKHILNKYGGTLGTSGSVAWMFERKAVLVCTCQQEPSEEQQLKLIESGADDWERQDNELIIYSEPQQLQSLTETVSQWQWPIISSDIEYLPKETQSPKQADTWQQFSEELENDDDINNFYTNADV